MRKIKCNSRGQIFSTDFALGLIVFSAVLVLSFAFLNEASSRSQEALQYDELREHAFNALNVLVYSEGSPSSWNELELQEVKAFGLANSRNILNLDKLLKLEQFAGLNYSEVRELLGLQKFDFKLSVSSLGGGKVLEFGSEGYSKASVKFRANKIALLNQEIVLASLEVFA